MDKRIEDNMKRANPKKAITLHEPWASLVVNGEKRVETRGWKTSYRGELYIHAAQSLPSYARDAIRGSSLFQKLLIKHELLEVVEDRMKHHFDLGAIIGVVNLVDCRKSETIVELMKWAKNKKQDHITLLNSLEEVDIRDWRQELLLGNYDANRFGWVFANIVKFEQPVFVKGFQRIWNIPFESYDSVDSEHAGSLLTGER